MKRSSLPGVALASILTGLVAYAGCANETLDVVVALDGGDPPTFTDLDAGAEAATEELLLCIGTECPYPYATCLVPDRDGELKVGFKCESNLLTDDENCGACGNVCPSDELGIHRHMVTHCVEGACQRQCATGSTGVVHKDCNMQIDDGCEVDIMSDPAHCGGCDHPCPEGTPCFEGKCGCPPGSTYCPPLGCRDTTSDPSNCGRCYNQCDIPDDAGEPPPNMHYGCVASECGRLRCNGYWKNCDGEIPLTGCEVDTSKDPKNCGGCGIECAPGQICYRDNYGPPQCGCADGQAMCGKPDSDRWCADLLIDPKNCGACGHACPGAGSVIDHAVAKCRKGFCDFECEPGWGDCDGKPYTGCETNLMIHGGNCGACGNRCDTASGQPCVEGKCLMAGCDAGIGPQ